MAARMIKTIHTWASKKHRSTCPGGSISLQTGCRLDDQHPLPGDGMCLRIETDTWGKRPGEDGKTVHFDLSSATELRDFLNDFIQSRVESRKLGLSSIDTKEPTVTTKNFSTTTQQKVWDHLTSGEGDSHLRMEALQLLTANGFFGDSSRGDKAVSEALCHARLQDMLNLPAFDKFCRSGKDRLIAAASVDEDEFEAVIEVRVPIKKGSTKVNSAYDPENDKFNKGGLSLSKVVADHLNDLLKDHIYDLNGRVGTTYFQTNVDKPIKATGKGCEKVEK